MVIQSGELKVMQEISVSDLRKGILNIGSDPENDIVIQGPGVRPFHAMLMLHEKPYQVIPLDPQAEIRVRGVSVSGESAIAVSDLRDLAFGGYSLTIQENAGQVESISVLQPQETAPAQPARIGAVSPAGAPGGAGAAAPVAAAAGTPAPADPQQAVMDEVIVAQLIEARLPVECDQTADFLLRIVNGGPIVATFEVQVTGLPEEWVSVHPARVNLYEGGSAEVHIAVTPPRKSSSAAGSHPFQVTITSPNHPGRRSVLPADLDIAPYHEFNIGDLSPQRRTIPWRKRFGEVSLGIRNRGNSPSTFRLMAQDDANECQFQFEGPNGLKQISQVEYNVPAGETQQVPVFISPLKRSLVRMTSRQHPYRVSVAQVENETLSLFTMGTAISRPLIGILGIILALLITAGLMIYLFTPRIELFQADNSVVGTGESTKLHWKTFFFTHDLSISGIEDPIKGSQGEKEIFPAQTVNAYTLSASTWLWNLLGLEPKTRSFTILSVPNEPEIDTFTLTDTDVIVGDSVLLRWSVQNASRVALTVNGVRDVFEDPKDFNGERTLLIEMDTLVSIEATNALGTTVRSGYIFARPPTIVIEKFELDKATIYKGEQVTILWQISGTGMADGGEVTIAPFETVLPLEGELTFFPEESMEFVLTVRNRQMKEVRILPVGVLEPDAPPEPPTINFFTAAPEELVGPGDVELAWSISGPFDLITIKNGQEVIADGLPAQGFRTIKVAKSGTYVITSTYAGESSGKELKITVNPALLKAVLKVVDVYPTTGLELTDTANVAIICEPPKPGDPPPTGVVIVSDGTSSCPIPLPETNCKLTFTTPGPKSITATYQGGPGYIQSKSDPYLPVFEVMGNQISINARIDPATGPYFFSQEISVRVRVEGANPNRIPDGILRVRALCDESGDATYIEPCTGESWVYKLQPPNDGFYEFVDLQIKQLGGVYGVQVSFFDDTYYNNAIDEKSIPISSDIKSPVSMSMSTTATPPGSVGVPITYRVMVVDDNSNGLYVPPAGTLAVTGKHTDGTEVACTPTAELTASSDGRRSYIDCNFTATKAGTWTFKGVYASSHVWHVSTELNNIGQLSVNSATQIILQTPPASLYYGVTTTLTAQVSNNAGQNVETGSLTCAFPSASDGTCTCTFDSVSKDYDCALKPTTTSSLPRNQNVTFTYTPGEFLSSATLSQTFSIEKAATTVYISDEDQPVGPYKTSESITLTFNVRSTLGGDAPAAANNDVTIQLGTAACNSVTGMGTAYLDQFTATSGSSKTISFKVDYATGSNLRLCFRYNGSSRYNSSSWVSSNPFLVKSEPTLTAPTSFSFVTSQNASVSRSFSITFSNVRNAVASNFVIVNPQNNEVVCPSTSATLVCTQGALTSNTITFNIATSQIISLTVEARYNADNSNFAAASSYFTISSTYEVNVGNVSVSQGSGNTNLWAYSGYEAQTGDTMTTNVTSSISFTNFTGLTDYDTYGLTASVTALNSSGTVMAQDSTSGACTISGTGSISCPGIKVLHSATSRFRVTITAAQPDQFSGTLQAQSGTVNVIQNIIEDPGANTTYKITLADGGCAGKTQQFNITGYAAGNGDAATPLLPSDFLLILYCEKDNDGNDDWDNVFIYASTNSSFSTSMGWTGSVPNMFSFQITPNNSHIGKSACDYQVEKVKVLLTLGLYNPVGDISLTPIWPPQTSLKDYETFGFDAGDVINDNNNRSDGIMFDDCGDN